MAQATLAKSALARNFQLAVAAFTAFGALSMSSAVAQTQQQLGWCLHGDETFSPRLRIDGCTAMIQTGRYSGENLSTAHYNRGIAHFKLAQYDRAIADFNHALELDPNSTFTLNNRGTAYARIGQYDRAIEDFNRAIRINANHAITFNNRGSAYAKKGQYDRAIADFDQAIQLDPKDESALNNRKLAERLKGKTADGADGSKNHRLAEKKKLIPPDAEASTATPADNREPAKLPNIKTARAENDAADTKKNSILPEHPKASPPAPDANTVNPTETPEPAQRLNAPPRADHKTSVKSRSAVVKNKTNAKVAAIRPQRPKRQSVVARIFRQTQIGIRKVFRLVSRQ